MPKVRLIINEEERVCDADLADYLSQTLREGFGLTGTKRGCDTGGCGVCTVLCDGKPVYSCMYPTWRAEGSRITTIEGLASGIPQGLTALQETMLRNFAFQCGYCTSAMLLAGTALLESRDGALSDAEVREAICGIICRCTDYERYVSSIVEASRAQDKEPLDSTKN